MWKQIAVYLAIPWIALSFDPASQDDSQALARHFVKQESPKGPAFEGGKYVPVQGETVSVMGGATVFEMQRYGFVEAGIQCVFPDKELEFRNLGWAADTVYRQQRPMFFYTEEGDTREGSIPDQREKIKPGTFVLFFGRMESLDGEAALPAFEQAYEELITSLGAFTSRMILVQPFPFPEVGPAGELAAGRNRILTMYAERIESLAKRNQLLTIEIGAMPNECFEKNGLYLSEIGQEELARQFTTALGVDYRKEKAVVEAVRKKNVLWDQYYRPTNWAFLFGDRQWVPSSRDHKDESKRWFVEELQEIPGLVAKADQKIWEVAK